MGKGLVNLTNLNQGINVNDLDFGLGSSNQSNKNSAPVYIKPQANASANPKFIPNLGFGMP
jgi:hypothetical protein